MAVCLSGSTCGPTSGVKAGGPSRGMKEGPESEGALRRATPINPSAGGSEKSLSAATTGLGGVGAGSGSQNSPTTITAHVQSTGSHGQYSPAAMFASQHHQAVAAGLFGASMGLGPAGLPLPALMASLQAAAAGVLPLSLRPNSNLSSLLSGHGGQNLSYPFPMSQQEALLTWSKLAQSSAAHARNMASSPVTAGNLNLNNLAQLHHHASQHSPSSKAFLDLPGPLGTQKDEKERSINRSDGVGGGKPVTTRVRKSNKASIGNRKEGGSIEREKMDLVVEGKGPQERRNSSGVLELITHEAPSPTDTASPPSNGSSCGKSAESSGRKTRAGGDPSRDKVFSCSICHRTFGYKHVLQNHERTHTGEKPFECKQCGKRFTRDHHLKTHMRLHTGEKPYNCTHCDRQFVQVANLRRHLRVHTGERPYACELCTSRFSDSNQLKAHMLIHKGEKPFGCERCSGRFRRRHHLMHHKCPKDDCDTLSTNSSTTLGRRKRNNVTLLSSEKTTDLMDADDEPPQTPSSYSLEDELMDLHDEDLEESEEFQRYGVRSSRNSRTTTGEYGTTPSLVVSSLDMTPQRPTEATSVRLLAEIHTQQQQKRGRKPRETRRVIRIPGHPSSTVVTPPDHHHHHLGSFPLSSHTEQTEPEDLSTMTRPCLPRNLGSLGMKPPLSVRSRQTDDEDGDSDDA